jgi:uncharacterized protein YndB with AHSA1/START domain
MAAKASEVLPSDVRGFTLTRLFAAPRELVFRSFVEPGRMKYWWAPRGFTMLSCALDLREGGAWRMRIRSDESGAVQTELGNYREIRAPERLVFTHAWLRADGSMTHPTLVIVRFIERGEATEVNFRQEDFATARACQSHEAGWTSSLDLLTEHFDGRKSR